MSDIHSVHTVPLSLVPLSLVHCPLALQVAAHASPSPSLLEFSLSAGINHIGLDTCPKSCQFMALGRLASPRLVIRRSCCLPGACTCATTSSRWGWVPHFVGFRLKVHSGTLCLSYTPHYVASSALKNSSDFNCSLSSVSAGKLRPPISFHAMPCRI